MLCCTFQLFRRATQHLVGCVDTNMAGASVSYLCPLWHHKGLTPKILFSNISLELTDRLKTHVWVCFSVRLFFRNIGHFKYNLKWFDNIGPLRHLPSLLLSADIRVEYRRPAPPWRGNVCSERPPSSRAPTPLSSTEADNYKEALPS